MFWVFLLPWKLQAVKIVSIEGNYGQFKFFLYAEAIELTEYVFIELNGRRWRYLSFVNVFECKRLVIDLIDFNLTEVKQLFVSETVVNNSHIFNNRLSVAFVFRVFYPCFLNFTSWNLLLYFQQNFFQFLRFLLCFFGLFFLFVFNIFLFAPFFFIFYIQRVDFCLSILILWVG